jgi:hypothetical protein
MRALVKVVSGDGIHRVCKPKSVDTVLVVKMMLQRTRVVAVIAKLVERRRAHVLVV